jgi:SAM-dependent methyltransferase
MAQWYTTWMSPGTAAVSFSLFGHLGLLSKASGPYRVLETHAGDAQTAAQVLPVASIAAYTATDFSPGMIAAAEANLGDRATVLTTDSVQLPFPDASFDRYLSNLGMFCTSNLSASLSEARRVLAPGGAAAMSLRIECGDSDTSFRLIQETLAPFGATPPPDREGILIGKDLPALRARLRNAGFEGSIVAWHTWATLPIHDADAFLVFATSQPPTQKLLASLDAETRAAAETALRSAGAAALEKGAIQVAVAAVVAWC